MKKTIITLSIFSALNFSSASAKGASVKAEFNQQYQQYQAAVASGDQNAIELTAKNAYALGEKAFGPSSINALNLGINYTNALANDNPEKLTVLNKIIKLAKSNHPTNLKLLFDATLPRAEFLIQTNAREAITSLEGLAESAQSVKDYELASIALFEAAKLAANTKKQTRSVRKLILKADKINQAYLPETSVQRLTTDLWVAALDQSRNRKNAAIERLEGMVKVFNKNLEFDHPIELAAHSRLVHLYELKNESDKATKHCIAIAKMIPWQDNIEQTPLYRQNPKYPTLMARKNKSGTIQLQFTISKTGFVKDIEVLNTSHEGLVKTSTEALEKWRYAPKFVNGEAVEAISSVQLDYKMR